MFLIGKIGATCALDTKWWNHSLSSCEYSSSMYSFSGNWKVARFLNFSFLIHCLKDTTLSSSVYLETDVWNSQLPFSPGHSSHECNIQSLFSMCLFLCIISQCTILRIFHIFIFFMFHFYVSSFHIWQLYFHILTKLLGF